MLDDVGLRDGHRPDHRPGHRPGLLPTAPGYLQATYAERFTSKELRAKRALWQVLVRDVFQQYVPADGVVLDLGAGYCEFVNAVQARRKVAVDLNPDTRLAAAPDVDVVQCRCDELTGLRSGTVDTVFSSNFFEHLPDKTELLRTLVEARRVLRSGGRIVVLMPNIRNLPGAYWDYLDHHLPLTHVSLVEALRLSGFTPTRVVPRFLPYTVRSRFPVHPLLIRAYLRLRPAWWVLGRQMLVVAERRG